MNYLSYDFENQGFYSKNPLKIEDIKFDLDINEFNCKPKWALWTSTIKNGTTDWITFCETEMPDRCDGSKLYRVKLKNTENMRILYMTLEGIVNNEYDEFIQYKDGYGKDFNHLSICLDYKKIALKYDIVHFPVYLGCLLFREGFKNRLQEGLYMNVFYLMDCECSIFLNTNFIDDISPFE